MTKMKRYLYIIAAILTAGTASAQDDISKQLEVTRAYTPKVGQADKLRIEPRMVDTVQLRPDIEYSITPIAWATAFTSDRYAPASMSAVPFEIGKPLYVRAGFGFPIQSTADVYFTPRMRRGSTFGLFFNHRGSYSRIPNDIATPDGSTEMLNGAGLFGSKLLGRQQRYTISGELKYDNRYYRPYGAADIDIPLSYPGPDPYPAITKKFTSGGSGRSFSLGRLSGGIGFGDDFTDLSKFNFRIGLDLGYAHGGREQADVDFRTDMAYMITPNHGFAFGLSEHGRVDVADGNGSASTLTVAPRYMLHLGDFDLSAGVDADWVLNRRFGQHHMSFAPAAEGKWSIAGGRFVPFFSFESRLLDGSYEALSRRNPFLISAAGKETNPTAPTGWSRDLRVGIMGDVDDIFTYKFSGGVSFLEDYHIFVAHQNVTVTSGESDPVASFEPAMFDVDAVNGARFTIGAEVGVHNLGGFSARLYTEWNKFDFRGTYPDYFPLGDLPKYNVGLEAAYRLKDIFTVRAGAELIGDREYNNISTTYDGPGEPIRESFVNRIGPAVDVSLGAEVKAARDFWVFLEGRNLADQRLHPYNHYRGLGANVMLGVKAVF